MCSETCNIPKLRYFRIKCSWRYRFDALRELRCLEHECGGTANSETQKRDLNKWKIKQAYILYMALCFTVDTFHVSAHPFHDSCTVILVHLSTYMYCTCVSEWCSVSAYEFLSRLGQLSQLFSVAHINNSLANQEPLVLRPWAETKAWFIVLRVQSKVFEMQPATLAELCWNQRVPGGMWINKQPEFKRKQYALLNKCSLDLMLWHKSGWFLIWLWKM